MSEKIKPNTVIVILSVCLAICVFAGGFFAGRSTGSQRGDAEYSGRDDEHSRQTGLAAELIGQFDEGLGRISEGLSQVAGDLGPNAGDIRVLAQRLQKSAIRVKVLEDDVDYLRGRIRDYYSNCDSSKID